MQRRTVPSQNGPQLAVASSRSDLLHDEVNDKNKRKKCSSNIRTRPIFALFVVLKVIGCVVLLLIQKKNLSETALQAEHVVGDWWKENRHKQAQQQNQNDKNTPETKHDIRQQEKEFRDPATARMEAQSSRWVDGEKMLKKKLLILM